jgi:hypothetical protein
VLGLTGLGCGGLGNELVWAGLRWTMAYSGLGYQQVVAGLVWVMD